MNNLEQTSCDIALDRVMEGMRCAQPSAGMQSRIVQALESREYRTESTQYTALWASFTRFALPVFACAAVLLAAALAHHRPTPLQTTTAPRLRTVPPTQITPDSPHQQLVENAAPRLRTQRARNTTPLTEPDPETTSLLDDMHAPSQPAPALPLTRQERYLLLLSRQGEREDVATVTPVSLPFTNPAEEKEFQKFFERSPLAPTTTSDSVDTKNNAPQNGDPQ